MAKLRSSPSSAVPYQKTHHILKAVEKRQSFHPQVAEDIAKNFDLDENEFLQELVSRLCTRGEWLSLEELVILTNYFNNKYASHLERLRRQRGADHPYVHFPLVDLFLHIINKRYTEYKEYSDKPLVINAPSPVITTTERNAVEDVKNRFLKSKKLGNYERGSEEEMYQRLLLMAGELSGIKSNDFLKIRTAVFNGLGRVVGVPYTDLARIEWLISKLNGTAAVIKRTTEKVRKLKESTLASDHYVDINIDIPLRFLLTKYKPHKEKLYALFSYFQQCKKNIPGREIAEYIKQTAIPIHPAHIRMLEKVISFKATRDIWHSYFYFDMDRYEYTGGLTNHLPQFSSEAHHEGGLQVDQLIRYLCERVHHMNRRHKKEIDIEKMQPLVREELFDQMKSPRCGELKSYGLLPTDVEAYYRLIDGLPIVELNYLETFIDAFRSAALQGSWQFAAEQATDVVNKTYNLRLSEEEREEWIAYGLNLKPASRSEKSLYK